MPTRYQAQAEKLLEGTGVTIGGKMPWDPQVHDKRFFERVITQGSLGLGESYMDGWWDCEQIDGLISRVLQQDIKAKLRIDLKLMADVALTRILNYQSVGRAFHIGEAHYDLGNDLYRAMLDKRMTYSCGYWNTANDLDGAQEAKLELVCRKLGLKQGDRVLDIGCGWGSFAGYAAEKYGAGVVGVTVSREQVKLCREKYNGLPVGIYLQDYRDLDGKFDHVVSIGMVEHVGYRNYRTFFEIVRRCLKYDGLFLLHTIGSKVSATGTDPWIGKYIFPNSMLPSAKQLSAAAEGLLVMEDWHNFGADYDKTLMAWHANFERHWDALKDRYDERFHRMWRYYLLACAGAFRARSNQLWQIVFSKDGIAGGYKSIR